MVKFNRTALLAFALGAALTFMPSMVRAQQSPCPLTAVVSVTAGNTTEIVPLAAANSVRVCSIAISMSAAGTAKFVQGTGTNCGTGTADITAAIALATGTPMAMVGTPVIFITSPANALCVTAATGNVTGFISYARN